jgi:hypothetical protein
MGWFRGPAERFVIFHTRTEAHRLAALEEAKAKQDALNKLLLAHVEATLVYIDADIQITWMDSAKALAGSARELAAALREVMRD